MTHHPTDDQLLSSYLRGDLPEPEADVLERRLLAEDDLFDLLEALEAELLAAVSRGELPPEETEWVLKRLASSPRGRERLALVRSFNVLADELPEPQPSPAPVVLMPQRFSQPRLVWSGLAAAAGLLLVVGLWVFSKQSGTPGTESEQIVTTDYETQGTREESPEILRGTQASGETEKQATAPQGEPEDRRPREIHLIKHTFELALLTTRSAEETEKIAEMNIPAGTDVIELKLYVDRPEDFKGSQVTVRNEAKEVVLNQTGLALGQVEGTTVLVLEIPAKRLLDGRYEIALGAEPEELTQEFKVTREER
jgi:hypothetical protein